MDYRREGDAAWTVLRRDLDDPILVWDTTTVPNGSYSVKIIASDAPSNAGRHGAYRRASSSSAFEIDNAPPEILLHGVRVESSQTLIVTFDVSDDHSPVQRVEYSQDGQEWKAAFPRDGIADSRLEHYELTIEGAISARGLTIRASDSMNNVATRQVER